MKWLLIILLLIVLAAAVFVLLRRPGPAQPGEAEERSDLHPGQELGGPAQGHAGPGGPAAHGQPPSQGDRTAYGQGVHQGGPAPQAQWTQPAPPATPQAGASRLPQDDEGPYDQMAQSGQGAGAPAGPVAGPGAEQPVGYSEDAQTGISASGHQTPAGPTGYGGSSPQAAAPTGAGSAYVEQDQDAGTGYVDQDQQNRQDHWGAPGDGVSTGGHASEHTDAHGTEAGGSTGMTWSAEPDGVAAARHPGQQAEVYEPAGTAADVDYSQGEPMADGYAAPGDTGYAPDPGYAPYTEPDDTVRMPPAPSEPFGPGSAEPGPEGEGPAGWRIKGNVGSMLFHTEDSPSYELSRADVWFQNEDVARAAGFLHWDRKRR